MCTVNEVRGIDTCFNWFPHPCDACRLRGGHEEVPAKLDFSGRGRFRIVAAITRDSTFHVSLAYARWPCVDYKQKARWRCGPVWLWVRRAGRTNRACACARLLWASAGHAVSRGGRRLVAPGCPCVCALPTCRGEGACARRRPRGLKGSRSGCTLIVRNVYPLTGETLTQFSACLSGPRLRLGLISRVLSVAMYFVTRWAK